MAGRHDWESSSDTVGSDDGMAAAHHDWEDLLMTNRATHLESIVVVVVQLGIPRVRLPMVFCVSFRTNIMKMLYLQTS